MDPLTGPQKKFLTTAWIIADVDNDYWFDLDRVSTILKIDQRESHDTLFALARQRQLVAPAQKPTPTANVTIAGYSITKIGREEARHLIDEAKKAKRTKRVDVLKTYFWPIIAAVLVTWINNRINTKPEVSATKVPAAATTTLASP